MPMQDERRHVWKRIIGLERRGAPIPTLDGNPLPDPTLLMDEDFWAARPADAEKVSVQDSGVVDRLS